MSRAAKAVGSIALMLLSSCGTALEETRPDPRPEAMAGAGERFTLHAHPPVQVTEAQYRAAMVWLLQDVRRLRRLTALPPAFEVVPALGEPLDPHRLAFANDYRAWCGRRHEPGDCLGALKDGPYLDAEARRKIAFDIALGFQWDGFTAELKGMAAPQTVRIVLLGAMVGYMGALVLPTGVTQVLAAGAGAALSLWLGAQTVWDIIAGWLEMSRAADSARSFAELRAVGERYGKILGANTARVLVMVVTAAISEGGLISKLLRLPGAGSASAILAAESGGMKLAELGQVRALVVAPEGVSVVLAPATRGAQVGALAMASATPPPGRSSGQGKPVAPAQGPGQWGKAKSPARGRARTYQEQITGHSALEGYDVNGVEFDGYEPREGVLLHAEAGEDGVLLDAKGKGYQKFFLEDLAPKKWFAQTGAKKLIEQGLRQLKAVKGLRVRIRWHVAEEKASNAIRRLLAGNGCKDIEVVYTPPTSLP